MRQFNAVWKTLVPALGLAVAAAGFAGGAHAQLVINGETIADADLLAAAQKEGQLNLYGTWIPANQKRLSAAFTKDTGVKVSFVRAPSRKMYPRVLAEFSAGRLGADFIDMTDVTFILDIMKKGILTVPHKTPSWDRIPANLRDPQGRWYTFMRLIQVIGVNTAIVKPGDEPKSFKDLLDPKWKGRLGMPTIDAGGSSFSVQAFLREVVDPNYWKKFAAQNPRVYPAVSPTITDMVRGEISVALGGATTILNQKKSGAPAKVIFPAEGIPCFPLSGGVTSTAKHPNAGKLYLNYVTSTRGGEVIADTGNYSTNPDSKVPSEPGLDYPPQNKLWSVEANHWMKVRVPYSEEWRATFETK